MKKHRTTVLAILFAFAQSGILLAADMPRTSETPISQVVEADLTSPDEEAVAVQEEWKTIRQIEVEQSAPAAVELENEPVETPVVEKKSSKMATSSSLAYSSEPALSLETKSPRDLGPNSGTKITPMVGGILFSGRWGLNVRNQYTFGLAVELPVSRYFSFEIEGAYGLNLIAFTPPGKEELRYSFTQYQIGGNGKVYFSDSRIRPYIGAGLAGVYFDRMSRSVGDGVTRVPYSQLIASANLLAGVDVGLTRDVSLGLRAGWVIPVLNRPLALNNGTTATVDYEEANMINTDYYRLLGTLSIKL